MDINIESYWITVTVVLVIVATAAWHIAEGFVYNGEYGSKLLGHIVIAELILVSLWGAAIGLLNHF